jgi:hypothetical protein
MDNPNKISWETTNQTYLYPTQQLPYRQNSYQKKKLQIVIREKFPSAVKARDIVRCTHKVRRRISYL